SKYFSSKTSDDPCPEKRKAYLHLQASSLDTSDPCCASHPCRQFPLRLEFPASKKQWFSAIYYPFEQKPLKERIKRELRREEGESFSRFHMNSLMENPPFHN